MYKITILSKMILYANMAISQHATLFQISNTSKMPGIAEIRTYNLKPQTGNAFDSLFVNEALPLLKKWKIKVIDYGFSNTDKNTYYLIRAFESHVERELAEDAFYNSSDWKQGPREAILALIENYTTLVVSANSFTNYTQKLSHMASQINKKTDNIILSKLNARFIKNFLTQDVKAHNEIIHKDFVCIESNGSIVDRDIYLKNWATDFDNSGYKSFQYSEEVIRIFGNTALVKAKTTYTKKIDGKEMEGYTIYTDTYIKENGQWKCVQVQITPVK
jgi:Domain of unknown function (DUF4440)/NIPSNAP